MNLLLNELNCRQIIRIQHGNLQGIRITLKSNNVVITGNGLRNKRENLKVYFLRFKINKWDAQNMSLNLSKIVLCQFSLVHQGLAKRLVLLFCFIFDFIELSAGKKSGVANENSCLFFFFVN